MGSLEQLEARVQKGLDYLFGLECRGDQDSPEHRRWFGPWLALHDEYILRLVAEQQSQEPVQGGLL